MTKDKSEWEKYKEKERQVKPWDLLNPKMETTPIDIREKRLEVCRNCEFFISLTQQCKKCGCIMPAKTTLAAASCPEGKWHAVSK